jgi:ADP-ribose pyrophosphatase
MFEIVRSEVTYEGHLGRIRVDTVAFADGEHQREIAEHLDAVGIVAIDDDDRVVLVRQYRHAVGEHLLEIPAGLRDADGEEPADTAHRELAEEVGMAADSLVELVTFHNSAGWTEESTILYLATGLRPVERPDGFTAEAEEADMTLERVPFTDAVAAAIAGRVPDAKTLVGLLVAAARRAGPQD